MKNEAEAVTSLGMVFRDNTEIASFDELRLFKNVTVLQDDFDGCTSLTSVDLTNIVKVTRKYGNGCFKGSLITKAIMPSIQTLGDWAMRGAANLAEVFLGKDCQTLASWAFNATSALTTLVCAAETPPQWQSTNIFASSGITDGYIYVPDDSVNTYKAETNWASVANLIKPISSLATDNPTFYAEIEEYL